MCKVPSTNKSRGKKWLFGKIAVEFPPCFENFWEQFRKSGARWKMLFKYTLKNTVHWELNHQAGPNYRVNETTNCIYRIHFIWRNPRVLYNLSRKHTSRNHTPATEILLPVGPVLQLFSKRAKPPSDRGKEAMASSPTWVTSWFNATDMVLKAWPWNENVSEIRFSSVAQSCLTPCDPMNHSTPGLPFHH